MGLNVWSRAIAGKGMAALADQTVASATNFLTGVIIGRACTKEQFGLYTLGFSIWLLVMSLQTSLIVTPYMVYSPRLSPAEHARYACSTLVHQLALSALALCALALGGVAFSIGIGPRDLAPVAWTLAAVIPFILLREYIRQVSFATLRFKTALILDTGVSLVQIGGLLVLARLGLVSASTAYWVVGMACGLAAVVWLVRQRSTLALDPTRAIADLLHNWQLGKWVFASGLLWALSMELYPWILAAFHGSASTGTWAACLGVAAIGNPLLLGMMSLVGPKMAHSYAQDGAMGLRRYVLKTCAVSSLVMAPFCVLLLVFGESVVVKLYGDKYAGNGLVVSALAINLVVTSVAFSVSRALFAMERADLDFAVSFVALAVLLTGGLWLVKSLGPLGAAFALLAGNTASSAVRYLVFARTIRRRSLTAYTLS